MSAASSRPAGAVRRVSPFALALAGIVALAAVGFIVDLASSSLFIDEVLSWFSASGPLGHVIASVRIREANPPGYFLALNLWTHVFGDSVFALRLPSALAATATVAAVAWIAQMLGRRVAALMAALLAAVSPVLLEYAQQARPYAWAMLAGTLAAGCVLRYMDSERRLWLACAVAASVAAVWIHYTAWLVIAPMAAWVLTRHEFSRQAKAAFVIALALAFAVTAPLLYDQIAHGHHQGAIIQPASLSSIARVFGTPYDRLFNVFQLAGQLTGAVLVLAGVAATVSLPSRPFRARRLLIASLALAPPTVIVAIAALAQHGVLFHTTSEVVISRYTVVAAPFMIVALAYAVAALPRAVGGPLGVAALALAISGTVQSHESRYHYPDTGAAMRFIAHNWRTGDVLLADGYPQDTIEYYVRHLLPPDATQTAAGGRPIWTVAIGGSSTRAQLSSGAFAFGYRLARVREFDDGVSPVLATLSVPLPPPSAGQRAGVTRTILAFELAVARSHGAAACALLTPQSTAAIAHLAPAATCAAGIAVLARTVPRSERPRAPTDIGTAGLVVEGDRAIVTVVIAGHASRLNLRYVGRRWLVMV